MANKNIPQKKISEKNDKVDDLEIFIQKKKIQNEALKKIIERINNNKRDNNK